MKTNSTKYVALLRGINLGGRTVKMDKLRATFEAMGFTEVKTLLASGNVVFATTEKDAERLRGAIEVGFAEAFGFDAHIILRSAQQIAALVKAAPYKGVKIKPGQRLHVTFLDSPLKTKPQLPKGADYAVVVATKEYVAGVVEPTGKTPDYMDFLGEEFGDEITTRTWNTVEKIHKLLSE